MPEGELAYCHACGVAMDVSGVEPFTNVECPSCTRHTRVKREFGSYTLLRRHAIGGMSVVFIGQDNTLDREVVVKLLNKEYSADENRIGAFEEEARITASISHPNVVRVFTTGRAFGRFFIAMEYVTGGHFEHHIRERGTIPEGEALAHAIEVAEGLKAAHNAGLIHRDMKPGNILIDGGGSAKIVDFGLALVTKGGKAKASEIWATPYYVPPETIEGHEEDFRSDIYAFGSTFYHALSGTPPCDEESMDTGRLRQAKQNIRPLAKAAGWLHPDTCAVIDRCMDYSPDGRFRSYDDLISALRNARESAASQIPPPAKTAVPAKGMKSARRASLGSKVALGAAILVVVGAAAFALKTVLDTERPGDSGGTAGGGVTDGGDSVTPVSSNPGGVEIAKLYAEAGQALGRADYRLARERFASVRDHRGVLEPTGSWAACEAVAAAFLEGDASGGRRELKQAIEHVENARGLNGRMRDRLLGGLRSLRGWAPPRPVDPEDRSPAGYLLALLAGLKNWEHGLLDAAEPQFLHVAGASPRGGNAWIKTYTPIVKAYLADLAILRTMEPDNFALPPDECRKRIDELEVIRGELKTRGRARFNVRCWQLELEKAARGMGRPAARPGPDQLGALFRDCRFADADEVLRRWDPDKEEDQVRRRSLTLLNQAAIAFLAELGEKATAAGSGGPVRNRDGVSFPKVMGGGADGLQVVGEDGKPVRLAWSELDPESLIDLHRQLVKDSAAELETFRRHEQAIAFGLLAGDPERAKSAGEKLARLSSAFRRRWEQIAPVVD